MNDEERLLSTVERSWGLRVRSTREALGGEATTAYVLEAGSDLYFLRVYDRSRGGARSRGRLDRVLPLMRALAERGICPAPIEADDGRLFQVWEGRALVLFEWMEGDSLDPMRALRPDIWRRLAPTIGRVHRSTPEIEFAAAEKFDVPFRTDLRDCLGSPGPFRDLLHPRADEIRDVLALLDDLGARARLEGPRRVLTHGDLHGGNRVDA